MYHQNYGEACHILGFHRDASGAFLKGIKLRAGQELIHRTSGKQGDTQDLEAKIKELTAQYQADLELEKERFEMEAKAFENEKVGLTTEIFGLKDKLEETYKKIQQMEKDAKDRDAKLAAAQERRDKEEMDRINKEKAEYAALLEKEKEALESTQSQVKEAEQKLEKLKTRIDKNLLHQGFAAKAINNFNRTVDLGFAPTIEEKDSDEEDEADLRKKIKMLEEENARLRKRIKQQAKADGKADTTRYSLKADEKARILSFLSVTRLFNVKIALKPSCLDKLLKVCDNTEELYQILGRLSRNKDMSKSIEDLITKVEKSHKDLKKMTQTVFDYLNSSSCTFWLKKPKFTLNDMDKFELSTDKFFAFRGPSKVEDGGKTFYQPASRLQPIKIEDIADVFINGLRILCRKGTKFTTLDSVIKAMVKVHDEECKNQDGVLFNSREAGKILSDFFSIGVPLFTSACSLESKHLHDILRDCNNNAAIARRKLEQVAVRGLLFDSPEELILAIAAEPYLVEAS